MSMLLDWIALPAVFGVCAYYIARRVAVGIKKAETGGECSKCADCAMAKDCGRTSCKMTQNEANDDRFGE